MLGSGGVRGRADDDDNDDDLLPINRKQRMVVAAVVVVKCQCRQSDTRWQSCAVNGCKPVCLAAKPLLRDHSSGGAAPCGWCSPPMIETYNDSPSGCTSLSPCPLIEQCSRLMALAFMAHTGTEKASTLTVLRQESLERRLCLVSLPLNTSQKVISAI